MAQQPVFVVVSGGVVQETPSFVEVIDFDNLLPDIWSNGDSKQAWEQLSTEAQDYVKTMYPDDYAKIQERIAEDAEIPIGLHGK